MKVNHFSRRQWSAIALSIAGSIFQSANAVDYLPDIMITAPRPSLEQNLNNPQILEESDLTIAHETSITNVLEGAAGISMTRAGYGQQSALLLRGAGGLGLITLDDMPLLQSLPGLHNLDTLPVEAIQKAQIERGPGAIYRPFQALGGTIRLYTQDKEKSGARLSLEGGSFGILRETLQGSLAGKPGRATLTLSRGDAFDGTHLAAAVNNPEREPFRFSQGILRFSSQLCPRLLWQGSVLYRKSSVDTDAIGLDNQGRVAYKDDRQSYGNGETWLAQNTLDFKLTPHWTSHFQAGFTQLNNFIKVGALQSSMLNRIYLATWQNQHTLLDDPQQKKQWQFTWGGQGRHEQAEEQPRAFQQERTMAAGFADMAGQYGRLSGQLGVRVEHFDQFGDQPLFKTSAAWHINRDFTLRASGGTGYRIPGYTEMLSLFFGNLTLKPERSASGELALDWYPMTNMHIAATGYFNRYDNLIAQVYSPQRGPVSINIADADVSGMELDAEYTWLKTFDIGFNYTFNNSRDLLSNRELPVRPAHTGRVWGQHRFASLPITLWTEAVVRSSSWNDTANTLPIGQSVQVNAAIRYALSEHFEVYLRGENLTNNRTSQFYSFDTPGVAIYGGLQLKL